MIKSGNPALGKKTFERFQQQGTTFAPEEAMTLNGTVNKTGILLILVMISAAWIWNKFDAGSIDGNNIMLYVMGGGIGGFIVAMITVFKPNLAGITAPIYAVLEGLFLGGISARLDSIYPGIAFQAVEFTFGIFFALLLAYKSGLIKPSENFKLGVTAATGGIALLYMLSFVLSFFGIEMTIIHGNSLFSIGFSVVVIAIAAANLVMDFDFIEEGVEKGAPKYMEWYGAFGLLVTLVWLYLEILRLLAKLQSRE